MRASWRAELVDDDLRQVAPFHIVERGVVDHKERHPPQSRDRNARRDLEGPVRNAVKL